MPDPERTVAWKLEGTYFETCSCEVVCPCTASLALGADVSGLTVAAVADTPKFMSDGNRRLGVFIDDAASEEQAEKLSAVFGGQLGGPMEALAPLIRENLGLERAPIEVREEGLRHSIKIGDAVDVEIEDVVPFRVSPSHFAWAV